VYTGETSSAYPGEYLYSSGWYQLLDWSGNVGAGAVELNASHGGHYYSAVETTYWVNSSNKVITSSQNSSTLAYCG